MSDQYFDYDQMIQTALKSVVVKILEDVSQNGLKGDHHYYVAFKTQDEDVRIPRQLREKYPEEMTIVIQHRYWGLKVYDDYFEIGLSFNQKPELLKIPYSALIGFVDPSAQFALQFEYGEDIPSNDTDMDEDNLALEDFSKTEPKQTDEQNVKPENNGPKVVTLDAFRKKK